MIFIERPVAAIFLLIGLTGLVLRIRQALKQRKAERNATLDGAVSNS